MVNTSTIERGIEISSDDDGTRNLRIYQQLKLK